MERILQLTADGSHTISIPDMMVAYHSKHGAIQESMHVFIEAGLSYKLSGGQRQLNILEIGFGTGLNALLTFLHSSDFSIRYETLEKFPLEQELVDKLNYGDVLNHVEALNLLQTLHQAPWHQLTALSPTFDLFKREQGLENFSSSEQYDLIYFDAFAPTAQPELWTESIFHNLYNHLKEEAILVTYCSKTVVRKALQAAGFQVEKIPGPRGKREMLRAHKNSIEKNQL